jgi:hypothetical protein
VAPHVSEGRGTERRRVVALLGYARGLGWRRCKQMRRGRRMEEEASWASWMGQLVVGKEGKGEGKMWAVGLGWAACRPTREKVR